VVMNHGHGAIQLSPIAHESVEFIGGRNESSISLILLGEGNPLVGQRLLGLLGDGHR